MLWHEIAARYFGLPYGFIWSNLIASAICSAIAWWRLRIQAKKNRRALEAQSMEYHEELKRQAAAHKEDLKAHIQERLIQHHEELKTHISGTRN